MSGSGSPVQLGVGVLSTFATTAEQFSHDLLCCAGSKKYHGTCSRPHLRGLNMLLSDHMPPGLKRVPTIDFKGEGEFTLESEPTNMHCPSVDAINVLQDPAACYNKKKTSYDAF